MTSRQIRTLTCLFALAAVPAVAQAQSTATYRVTFDATWSAATHPTAFPPSPHFSGLVGATHSDGATLWQSGELASTGIERMAETGSKSVLLSEIGAMEDDGFIGATLSGGGIGLSPGRVALTFETSSDYPLLSLVSMIAPSPDWFVGTQSLSLRDDDGWIQTIEFELWPYDSGTDSGVSYTSPNFDTNPAEPIANISDVFPFTGTPALGTYSIELVSVECVAELDGDGVLTIFDFLEFQNLFDAGDLAADLDGDGDLTIFDFLAYQNAFGEGC
ncbi:MAG: spondin domain-containing protein [Phycisphaera sp.]|nr:MAG: spondin domain-containing protein [Phycisphaera sp.]